MLTLGQLATYGLSFIRNIILARALTKADFGLASIMAMTVSVLELAGRMSFGQQIIQSKEGGGAAFEATSHAFQALMSGLTAVLILALACPTAILFRVPEHTWAFALLALVPLVRSFEHLDFHRRKRDYEYLPSVLIEVVPQAVLTSVAWPLTLWLGDFRVILWLMIGKIALGVAMSHWLAARPYCWAWNAEYLRSMWGFGWPLLLNGVLFFACQQADQIVVAKFLSLEDLGAYALAFSLVSIPWQVFGSVGSSLLLPLLSQSQGNPVAFRQQYRVCIQFVGVSAVALMLPLIVAGEQIVTLVYGEKYFVAGSIMAIMGLTMTIRFLRYVPAVAAMARADTLNQLYSNVWRCLSLPIAVTVGIVGGGVHSIAASVVVGEVAATVFALWRLQRRRYVIWGDSYQAALFVLAFSMLGEFLYWKVAHRGNWSAVLWSSAVLWFCAVGTACWAFPEVSRMGRTAIARIPLLKGMIARPSD